MPRNISGHGTMDSLHNTMQRANMASRTTVLTFGSPACPHCEAMRPALVAAAKASPNVQFANYNVTADPQHTRALNAALTPPNMQGRMAIDGVPTTFLVNGSNAKLYNGPRTAEGITAAVRAFNAPNVHSRSRSRSPMRSRSRSPMRSRSRSRSK